MVKLSLFKKLLVVLVFVCGFVFVMNAYAEVSITFNDSCECSHTPTPAPTATPAPTGTPAPSVTPGPTDPPANPGLSQAGAPVCTANKPATPQILSVVRKSTTATLTWTKIENASYYAIFYGTKPGNWQYGVPNAGNTTTFTIGALNPRTKYYFDVRAVNDCMPSDPSGQVLGASTTKLAGTSSALEVPRLILAVIGGIVTVSVIKNKKFSL